MPEIMPRRDPWSAAHAERGALTEDLETLDQARWAPAVTFSLGAVNEVARFYACRDFTVASRSAIENLRLEATDGPLHDRCPPA